MPEGVQVQGARSLWDVFDHISAGCSAPSIPATLAAWEDMAAQLRAKLHDALGVRPLRPIEPVVKSLGTTHFTGYSIERLSIVSRPGFIITANLYLPSALSDPAPAILCPHGHSGQKGKGQEKYQSLYIGLARKGFVVLAPDAIGLGERWLQGHNGMASPFLIGTSLVGMEIWDNMKCLDVLCQRPEVDPTRIGCIGNSGGGTQTIWVTALDQRIRVAVASDATTSFRYNHAKERNICFCNLAPGLMGHAEMHHVLGLAAPRPLLLVGGSLDKMFPWDLQRSVFRQTKRIYALYGAEERIAQFISEEPHGLSRKKREAAYAFFLEHLMGITDPEASIEPNDVQPLAPDDPALICYPSKPPELRRSLDAVIRQEALQHLADWKPPKGKDEWRAFRQQKGRRLMSLLLRKHVASSLGIPQKHSILGHDPSKAQEVAIWSDPFTPVLGTRSQPTGSVSAARLIIDSDGRHSDWSQRMLNEAASTGCMALAVDLRGWGELRARELSEDGAEDEWVAVQKGLGYDVPLLGLRLQDALEALQWLKDQAGDIHVELYGRGLGAVIALLAGVMNDTANSVYLEHLPASLIPPADHPRRDFVSLCAPNLISQVGDVVHLIGLLAPRHCRVVSIMPDTQFLWSEEKAVAPAWACYEAAGAPEALCF
ncbi:MAG: prolyl oligopeptidase family serine peptidase [Firmicutes bacterium]|jgi:dienelactone hydrolase|nr:prolyl oligopeptidase family serine peptidase [Bacillota bacterium]